MPAVYVKYNQGYLLCPNDGRINVKRCYGCPFYKFRNFNYVVCDLEFRRKFGENYEVVKKDPLIVRDDAGNMWIWTNGNSRQFGWYRYKEDGMIDFETSLD